MPGLSAGSLRLLATDLDGTFIGDRPAMHELWKLLELEGIDLVFSTGRHMPSIQEFYNGNTPVTLAVACVCMVGTEIWHLGNDRYSLDEEWAENISVGWDRQTVDRIARMESDITPQPLEWQSPLKASYYLEEAPSTRVAEVTDALREEGVEAKVVYSADLFLDVLPARSGKGEAVSWVCQRLGVDPSQVITAGDSGNDLDMMRPELGFRSIAVGNAKPELRAADLPNIYQSSAAFAAGLKEGLAHYGWIPAVAT